MSDEVTKPGPVDNSHLDAGIAARAEKAEAQKPVEKEPTEPKVEAQTGEQNETEGTAASEADDAAAQRPKNKGVGKRIDELTREKYDAQRERDYWREQAMRNQRQPEQRQEQAGQTEQATDEPTLEEHGFDVAAYNRAWYDWRKQEDAKADQKAKEIQSQQERAKKYQDSVQAFAEANPDFYDVFHGGLPVTQTMAEAITDADNPASIAYYLGQNPEEAARIAGMSPSAVSRAIGRIEAKLESQAAPAAAEQARAPEQKTVTKAPPPVTTLSGAPPVVKDLTEMSMADYDAQRRKERKARGL
ncbi:LysR family transcriptional regulator [Stenotrophomonas maltophilia]|nr:LysR family transcriptional regulator [Stenotrophomonas maltophilia]